jgi:hypothetical protein
MLYLVRVSRRRFFGSLLCVYATVFDSHVVVDAVARESFHANPADMGLAPGASNMVTAFATLDRGLATGTVFDPMLFRPLLE